jgi:hypothetical protein
MGMLFLKEVGCLEKWKAHRSGHYIFQNAYPKFFGVGL